MSRSNPGRINMRFAITAASLSLISSALAITITEPTSGTEWDFSTPKTIKFTSDANDPSVISIILRTQDGSFQTKLADNVKTSTGEYTTQPNPSISNGSDYEIEIIDSSGELAVSPTFTVEKGASSDGSTTSTSTSSSSSTGTTLATSASSTSGSNSTAATTTAQLSTGAASTTFNAPQGLVALIGAALALLYV
ncbi:GPI anchored serine-threonine rich family protein [Aspergillus tubingensis]|uniref:GPI anchored serine-threonine rich family protein n=1 Tax=Aspergillus tubingensis TaxID=5068 RepID=UPI001579B0D7|nr:alpha/beta hydrolase family protein [Aspergillus tubingensis]GFN12724.1 alpha/beta hydrolase family protein [Aspergillus tubingensis]